MRKVLMMGHFDIIHSGHIMALKLAKSYGDYLIIGVCSDEMSRAIKGKGRPILSERERVFIVSHLNFVDEAICISAGGEYNIAKHDEKYLDIVRPDVFVRNKRDPEAEEICRKRNIELVVIPEIVGIDQMHVTDIIEKIKKLKDK